MAVQRTSSATARVESNAKSPTAPVQLPKSHHDGFAFLPSPSSILGAIKKELHFPWPGKGCADQIGWIQKVQPPTHDVTSQFESLDEKAKAGHPVLPADAKNYVYLSVPGVTSGAVPDEFYMDSNLDALKAAGCETARAPVNTFDGVEANAKVLRDTIQKYAAEGKKVVLVCHSMGGMD